MEDVVREYAEATKRIDELVKEAKAIGDRLGTLAHGLSSHPERMVIGAPDRPVDGTGLGRAVSSQPLPSIDHLITLTREIRETAQRIDDLRERLTLMGREDLVQERDRFFE